MTASHVRRDKAALFQWVGGGGPPGERASRKQTGGMEETKGLGCGWAGVPPLGYQAHLGNGQCLCQGPRNVAKPGDVVRVKVLEVDPKRHQISLTMRLKEAPVTRSMAARAETRPDGSEKRLRPAETGEGRGNSIPTTGDAMAEAFRRAGLAGKIPGRQ
jgi:hypothetical protein